MRARQSLNPGRIKLTFEDGSVKYATMERADNPVVEGHPLNPYTLLKDETCTMLGGDPDTMVPDDAFRQLSNCLLLSQVSPSLPHGNNWDSVVFGNGVFIATANFFVSDVVARSTNGAIWEAVAPSSSPDAEFKAVAFGAGIFVVMGRDEVACSTDGISWEISSSPGNLWRLAFGNGIFVASYRNGKLTLFSTDGKNWEKGPIHSYTLGFEELTFGNGIFVGLKQNECFYSTDGKNWTKQTITGIPYESVAYGSGKFVAVNSNSIWYSTDGINWTATTNSVGGHCITFGGGMFALINNDNHKALYSEDGINWDEGHLPDSAKNQGFNSMAYGNGRFVALSFNKAIYSVDGVVWKDTGYVLQSASGTDVTMEVALALHGCI